jgi:hypothetical protein
MKTIHGKLDHVMGAVVEPRLIFEGKTYALPEGSPGTPGFSWLVMARSAGWPVTLEVDDDGIVRAATVELGEDLVSFRCQEGRERSWMSGRSP